MSNEAQTATQDASQERVKSLVKELVAGTHPVLAHVLEPIIAATAYDDPTLIRSSLYQALELLRDFIQSAIQQALPITARLRATIMECLTSSHSCMSENMDEFGYELEKAFDAVLEKLTNLADGVQILAAHGFEVQSHEQLKFEIQAFR